VIMDVELFDKPEWFSRKTRARFRNALGYVIIVVIALCLIGIGEFKLNDERESSILHYRETQLARTRFATENIDAALNHLHRDLRTISLLDGVRELKRHAENADKTTIQAISQLYLNMASELDISEIYIVPADFDPARMDVVTGRLQQPIMSFDGLINNKTSSLEAGPDHAPHILPHIPTEEAPDENDPDQGDETEEYWLLQEQIAWAAANVGKLEPGFETNAPILSGPEVVTCDNSQYKTTHKDADRRGFVFSVPFYDSAGAFAGLVSAIIRTNELRKLVPDDALLVNPSYNSEIKGKVVALGEDSFDHARHLELDPELIYSTVQEIHQSDPRSNWYLWDGEPNQTYTQSQEARSAVSTHIAGLLIIGLLTISTCFVWAMFNRTVRLKSISENDLRRKVDERTLDIERLIEASFRAEAEAEAEKRDALREANVLLEQFIAYAPAAIAMFDLDLRYVAHTKRWVIQHGASDASLVGRHQFDALPQMGENWASIYRNCLNGAIERRQSEPFLQPDGSVQWLSWEMRPWHAPDGELRGLMMMTEDITERKAIEVELQKALDGAEAAARAKADFLANMSHELRTPLTGIIGSADILLQDEEKPLSEHHRQMVELQRTCGADLLSIVNDILDFSKADAGNLRLEEIPVVINDLISRCVATLAPSAEKKRLTVKTAIAEDVPGVIAGDPTRLRQVLLNLLSNAVKFSPEGGHVSLKIDTSADGHVRFAVTDSGIGILPEQRENLFTRFSQADTSTTRNYGGTGLGLAICRQMVELMHGSIDFESEPGHGATFFFDIPAKRMDAPMTRTDKPLSAVHATAHNVLVAEDNATNRLMISKMLEKYGCTVTLVTNGLEAVATATGSSGSGFDIILMDIQMPEMDGEEATRRIRAAEALDPTRPRIPIIALTANAFPEEVARYKEAGMDEHLIKPIDWPTLITTIERTARKGSELTAPSEAPSPPDGDASATHVLDPVVFAQLAETLGDETADEIVGLFVSELDQRLAQMSTSAASTAIAAEAHALASAAGSIGCQELADLCKQMETAVRQGQTDIGPRLARVLDAAGRAGKAVETARVKRPG